MKCFNLDIQELGLLNHKVKKTDEDKAREEQLLDCFNDIVRETSGLMEIEDVLDELKIISMVLKHHHRCLQAFDDATNHQTRDVAYAQLIEAEEMTLHAQRTRGAVSLDLASYTRLLLRLYSSITFWI